MLTLLFNSKIPDTWTIVYRINGGPWLEYTQPFFVVPLQVVEAAKRTTEGEIVGISRVEYNVIDSTSDWLVIG